MTVRAPDRLGDDLPMDVRRSYYSKLKRFYAAFGSREEEACNILFLGDSIVNRGFASKYERAFPTVFAEGLPSSVRPSGSGWYGVGEWLSPWVLAGGATLHYDLGVGFAAATVLMNANGETATITIPACDRFHLYFTGGSGGADAEVRVNGTLVSGSGFSTFSGTLAIKRFDSGTLDKGPKTIQVSKESGSNTNVLFSGVYAWNGDYGKGVQVWGIGRSGATAGDIHTVMLGGAGGGSPITTEGSLAMTGEFISPDCVILEMGGNDLINAVAPATFRTNVAQSVDAIRILANPDPSIIIMGIWGLGTSAYTAESWQPYREALRSVADEKNCVFLDLYELGGFMGTMGDSYHTGATTVSGTTTLTVPTGYFREDFDEGTDKLLVGDGIAGGAYISEVLSLTQVTMSANATASFTGTGRVTITRRDPDLLTSDGIHPSDRGHRWIAEELGRLLTPPSQPVKIGVPLTVYKTADTTTSSVTLADDPHLSLPVRIGESYEIEWWLWLLPAATTTGIRVAVNGPAIVGGSVQYHMDCPMTHGTSGAAGTVGLQGGTAFNSELITTTLPSTTIPALCRLYCFLDKPSADGYVTLRIASEVAANLVWRKGSWMRLTRVA